MSSPESEVEARDRKCGGEKHAVRNPRHHGPARAELLQSCPQQRWRATLARTSACSSRPPKRTMNMPTMPKRCLLAGPASGPRSRAGARAYHHRGDGQGGDDPDGADQPPEPPDRSRARFPSVGLGPEVVHHRQPRDRPHPHRMWLASSTAAAFLDAGVVHNVRGEDLVERNDEQRAAWSQWRGRPVRRSGTTAWRSSAPARP